MRMANPKDRTGMRYGRLVCISPAERDSKGNTQWLCKCDCGKYKVIPSRNLLRVVSCGCYKHEVFVRDHVKHGMYSTKLYAVYSSMKARCRNKNNRNWHNYGGRGITVCEEWLNDFKAFYDWSINNGYSEGLTLDRIDNDKGYSPDNCRWATYETQQNNKRTNVYVMYKGETKTPSQLAHKYGVNAKMVCQRVRSGWDIERALTEPCHTEFRRKNNG